MTDPEGSLARKLTQALQDGDLDTLVTTLHAGGHLTGRPAQHISNLRPVVTAAQRDFVSLLRPPADFHAWLQQVLLTNADGTPARPNTRISRVLTLRALYRALRQRQIITGDPLLDFPTEGSERRLDPIPDAGTLQALVNAARHDAALHAATLLLWHHALPVSTLLSLRWAAFDPDQRSLLRGDVISPLTPEAGAALQRLHHRAGFNPLFPDSFGQTAPARMFPYDTPDALRLRLLQVTREAKLPFIAPGQLKRAALRDHARSAAQLGYRTEAHFWKVVELARDLPTGDA